MNLLSKVLCAATENKVVTLCDQSVCDYLVKSFKRCQGHFNVTADVEGHFYHSPVFLSHFIVRPSNFYDHYRFLIFYFF